MHPELFKKYSKLLIQSNRLGIYFIVTQVARTPEYQKALYYQGRLPADTVNEMRLKVNLAPITLKQNRIVTSTLKSKHLFKTFPEYGSKQFSEAFDVAIIKPNSKIILWDKPDINNNNKNDYEELGVIGESLGLYWGGRFKNIDMPHYEIRL